MSASDLTSLSCFYDAPQAFCAVDVSLSMLYSNLFLRLGRACGSCLQSGQLYRQSGYGPACTELAEQEDLTETHTDRGSFTFHFRLVLVVSSTRFDPTRRFVLLDCEILETVKTSFRDWFSYQSCFPEAGWVFDATDCGVLWRRAQAAPLSFGAQAAREGSLFNASGFLGWGGLTFQRERHLADASAQLKCPEAQCRGGRSRLVWL